MARSTCDDEDELKSVRQEALERLEHSDRRAISRMAVMYATGQQVVNTPEIESTMTRWSDFVAEIRRDKQHEQTQHARSRLRKGWS